MVGRVGMSVSADVVAARFSVGVAAGSGVELFSSVCGAVYAEPAVYGRLGVGAVAAIMDCDDVGVSVGDVAVASRGRSPSRLNVAVEGVEGVVGAV